MQAIPVHVINLDRVPERLEHIRAQADAIGFEFRRVSAVDGAAPGFAESLGDRPPGPLRGQVLSPAQVACFRSHRKTWKTIVEGTAEYGMILEDDIVLTPDFGKYLESGWIPSDADLIRLESWWAPAWMDSRPVSVAYGRALHRLRGATVGTGAYLVSQKAAEHLLGATEFQLDPADVAIFDPASEVFNRLQILQMRPAPARQAMLIPAHSARDYARNSILQDAEKAKQTAVRSLPAWLPVPFRDMPYATARARFRLSLRYLKWNAKAFLADRSWRLVPFR